MSTYPTPEEIYLQKHKYHKRGKGEPKDTFRNRLKELGELDAYLAELDERKAKAKATREKKMQFNDPDYDYDFNSLEDINPEQFNEIDRKYNDNFKITSDKDYRSNSWYQAVSNRDLKYNPNLLLKKNAQKLAKRVKGRAFYGDINGDDIPDVTVFDNYGKMVAFNGYRPKRSRHLMNMNYVYANPEGYFDKAKKEYSNRIRRKDVNDFNYDESAKIYKKDKKDFKLTNKKLAQMGLAGYRIKPVRITLNQLLNDEILRMYDMTFVEENRKLVPFTVYKSLVIRAFLNMIFGVPKNTLAISPAGKLITKIINKKDKESDTEKRYDNYRTAIVNLFTSMTPGPSVDKINKTILKYGLRYQLGDASVKSKCLEDIAKDFEKVLHEQYDEDVVNIMNLSKSLLRAEMVKGDSTYNSMNFRKSYKVFEDDE